MSEAKQLARLRPIRSLLEIAWIWCQLALILAACVLYAAPWMLVIGVLLVGARQYGLLILLHDASHTLIHPNRAVNDRIALWLIAAPCGSSYFNSRRLHLLHHQNVGSGPADPDFFYYCSDGPPPKRRVGEFFGHFIGLIAGGQIFHTLLNRDGVPAEAARANYVAAIRPLVPVALVQAILFGVFVAAGMWWGYFLLWVFPLVTLAVFFNGVRTFGDHANLGPDQLDKDALMISYYSNPIERFFLSPYHMNYHAEHHFFPYVPHYNLPKLRELLRVSPDYRSAIQWRGSYLGFVWRYLRSS